MSFCMFLIPKSLGSPSIPKYHLEGLAQFTREEIENVPEWAALNSFPEELSQFTDEEQKIVPDTTPVRAFNHRETQLSLVLDRMSGHPPTCFTVCNASQTSFVYPLHLRESGLVLDQKLIHPPTEHEIYWDQRCYYLFETIDSSENAITNNVRPLTINIINDLLENRRQDDTNIQVKTEESAMKATSSGNPEGKCENGHHHPDANHIKAHCFELYPKQRVSLRDNTVAQKASTVPYSDSPQS
ncbi:hypothetical protein PCANC_27921 [Puccinia coronata f. sp. avenae]|uniref:Uncharacterized protein n=1 Tax=Puccinia coronata f. sp. avenae TaxID=200324 RepID=A0A2N5THW6_9BASI|nr:hypothetical protein PCANC_27921 [Puccinia coronata f. sp. avenae]